LDNSTAFVSGTLQQPDQSITYEFKVSNPNSCDSVVFFARALSGDPDLYISIRNTTTSPTETNKDFVSNFYGTFIVNDFQNSFCNTCPCNEFLLFLYRCEGNDALVQCCSELRRINPTWDGTVWIKVVPHSPTTFEVGLLGINNTSTHPHKHTNTCQNEIL
jgi:hypothetical protein